MPPLERAQHLTFAERPPPLPVSFTYLGGESTSWHWEKGEGGCCVCLTNMSGVAFSGVEVHFPNKTPHGLFHLDTKSGNPWPFHFRAESHFKIDLFHLSE